MMDFQIISSRVLLTVQGVYPIRGFNPPSVMVKGLQLNLTTDVYYNGVEVSEFLVSSPERLIVKIPASELGNVISDLKVFTDAYVSGQPAMLSFDLHQPLRSVEGVQRLVQAWMIVFFTTPGSDVWEPSSGGGVRSIIGRNTNATGAGVSTDLAQAVDRTNTELKRLQSANSSLPLEEKFMSASLQGVNFDESTSTLAATIVIKNVLGESAEAVVG